MLKIAFATSDGTAVDQHFGWCRRFDVYEVGPEGSHLLETRLLEAASDDEQDKIESRLAAVTDCAILNIADIGGTAAAKVVKAKIHPVKVAKGASVSDLLTRYVATLAGSPPPWLRKVLKHSESQQPAAQSWTRSVAAVLKGDAA
ncbi:MULTISPECIES: nitrogen fixation protein NifX [Frankia]|uniref:Nitrogen fixation protein NifX n=1 Tax=Candidatus Frankia alpina TaxID=2699483 RepID=A0A4S5ESA4_9ACTN|nr:MULTISPECIES: nitrogen fixation protein NifX [Frankia]THJ75266.1 nitrogen fixation protein NifX [Candidatus Frankia alpina]